MEEHLIDIPIVVLTNDKHLWLLRGFQYLFNKYWSPRQAATVAGFSDPSSIKVHLEDNFKFISIDTSNYPASLWTNGLIKVLRSLESPFFILMLEDYWLYEQVATSTVSRLCDFMSTTKDKILRIDLTADRASVGRVRPYKSLDNIEIIQTPCTSKYQMSFQAAIWNVELLLEVLVLFEDPWTAEIEGTKRLASRPDLKVLGTLNYPVKYRPVYRTKRNSVNISALSKADQGIITGRGYV